MQIPAFRLIPEPLSEEARALLDRPSYVEPNVGERHRLGGTPDLLEEDDWPACETCGETMTFYAQLDALPSVGFDLTDAGLIHVFICFDCFDVRALLQSA